MSWVNLPAVDTIHPKSNKFDLDVKNKATGESKLNDRPGRWALSPLCHPSSPTGFHLKILGSCVVCAPLDRYIGRHINRHSTEVSADISTDTQPIYQSTYRSTLGRYIDRDMSVDISADISIECRSICRPTLDRYVSRYVGREWLSDCRLTCRSIGYQHSANTSPILVTVACVADII